MQTHKVKPGTMFYRNNVPEVTMTLYTEIGDEVEIPLWRFHNSQLRCIIDLCVKAQSRPPFNAKDTNK